MKKKTIRIFLNLSYRLQQTEENWTYILHNVVFSIKLPLKINCLPLKWRNDFFIWIILGTIMAVTSANKHSSTKTTRFVGICIERSGCGLRSRFVLRNAVDNLGKFLYFISFFVWFCSGSSVLVRSILLVNSLTYFLLL